MSWPDDVPRYDHKSEDWQGGPEPLPERDSAELSAPLYSRWAGPLADVREMRVLTVLTDIVAKEVAKRGTIAPWQCEVVARAILKRLSEPL